ncbi:MAG TPA: hypothetical protein ENF75_06220, partial [Acidilobales archaeon]|nr:hypothetical protein [Acidilobales archaeon]
MSEWRSTNLTRPCDFELSLFPSLNYVLFEKVGRGRWVKLFGFKKGSYIEFVDENKVRFTGFTGDELRAYVGLWYDPLNYVNEVEHRYNEVIEEVINMYRRAGLPIAINDPVITFISAFLNRVTNYHTNVVRWVRTLLKQVNEDITLINEDVLRNVSTSFQLVGLVNALRDFM